MGLIRTSLDKSRTRNTGTKWRSRTQRQGVGIYHLTAPTVPSKGTQTAFSTTGKAWELTARLSLLSLNRGVKRRSRTSQQGVGIYRLTPTDPSIGTQTAFPTTGKAWELTDRLSLLSLNRGTKRCSRTQRQGVGIYCLTAPADHLNRHTNSTQLGVGFHRLAALGIPCKTAQ
jgi:hypothetical protein